MAFGIPWTTKRPDGKRKYEKQLLQLLCFAVLGVVKAVRIVAKFQSMPSIALKALTEAQSGCTDHVNASLSDCNS